MRPGPHGQEGRISISALQDVEPQGHADDHWAQYELRDDAHAPDHLGAYGEVLDEAWRRLPASA